MDAYQESAYYYCWEMFCPVKGCDGYRWMDPNPPEGCLAVQPQKENEKRNNNE